jgi:hypothetical protein
MAHDIIEKHYDTATKNEQIERREDYLRDIWSLQDGEGIKTTTPTRINNEKMKVNITEEV